MKPTQQSLRFRGPLRVGTAGLVLGLLALSALAVGPREAVTIRGKAVSTAGAPVAGVKVTYPGQTHPEPTPSISAITDAQGVFEIKVTTGRLSMLRLTVEPPPGGRLAPCAVFPPGQIRLTAGDPPPVTVLLAPATARLTGKVLTETGQALADTTVTLSAGGFRAWHSRTAKTDRQGRFQFAHLAPGNYTIRSVTPPPGSAWIALYTWKPHGVRQVNLGDGATADEELRLPRGVRLRGRVLDEKGKPIGGAGVSCGLDKASEAGKPSVYQMPGQSYLATAKTDAAGRYVLGAVTQETYTVTISPPDGSDLAPARLRGINAVLGADVPLQDVTLYASGTLIGVATGADGKPLPKAAASVSLWTGRHSTAQADAAGRFVLTGLPTGSHDVSVTPPPGATCCPKVFEAVAVIGGLSVEQQFALPAGARLSGSVTDASGKPVAGATVSVRHGYSERGRATTDAAGKFRLAGLSATLQRGRAPRRPATWKLTVMPPQAATQLLTTSVPLPGVPAPGQSRAVSVTMKPAGAVTGVVTGPGGKPVAGCHVTASRRVGRGGISSTGLTRTGPDGRFLLAGISPGSWSITAAPPPESGLLGGAAASRAIPAGKTTTVNVALRRGATVVGKVTTSAGKGLPGAEVRLQPGRGTTPTLWMPGMNQRQMVAYTGPDGTFRIPAVPPGKHKLQCHPINPEIRAAETEVAVSGTGEHRANLQAYLTGSIEGTVRSGGKGLARGSLYLTLKPANGGTRYASAHPDNQGRYRIARLVPGRYSLTVNLAKRGQDAGLVAPPPPQVTVREGKKTKLDISIKKK